MTRIGHKRERDEGFYEWVRTQPEWRCIITGKTHIPMEGYVVERCHIRSRGAGGSDRWLMPLIREQHILADTNDLKGGSWWYRNKEQVAEWCALTLPVLWLRYDVEKKCFEAR